MNLTQYMKDVARHPVLSREEEVETAIAYRNGSMEARQKLINSNLRFVVYRAHHHKRYVNGIAIAFEGLVQEGNIGLIKAVDKFDPDRGPRLISYAVFWIDALIYNYVMSNFKLVKFFTTQDERKLFFKYAYIMKRLWSADFYGEDIDQVRAELAEKYKTKIKFFQRFENRSKEREVSMDSVDEFDDTLHDRIGTPAEQHDILEGKDLRALARSAVNSVSLTERELDIVRSNFLAEKPKTLAQIGKKYKISRERTRQIKIRALRIIREYLEEQGYTAQSVGVLG